MKLVIMKMTLVVYFSSFLFGCDGSDSHSPPIATQEVKNIILFVGDGMGEEHRHAARLVKVGSTGKLFMDDMPSSGFLQTYSANSPVTDSAAAATAMATGVKTNNGVIGLDANLDFVPTILEDAKKQGKGVGLVTSSQVTHATPAAFASHVENRNMMTTIAEQFFDSDIDVLLGGGEDEFLPITEIGCYPEPGERGDGRNLIQDFISVGYTYVCDLSSFKTVNPSSSTKLLGLFSDEGMIRPFSPSLAEMTQTAIDILSKRSAGFFLMVEAAHIDWASHDNDAANVIFDTVDFDDAVRVAQEFALTEKNTLIIVTADHETGGMSVSRVSSGMPDEDGPFSDIDGGVFYINWSTTGHTSDNVPITSQGPNSELFSGTNDNTFVHQVMHNAFIGD